MLVTIQNARPVGGTITAPPSKSMAHRAVLCAALAEGRSHITNLEFSKDISATLGAAAQLCARVRTGADDAVVEGLGHFVPLATPVDCCESGSTLRFCIPAALLSGGLPLALPVAGTLPLSSLNRRLNRSGSAVAGYAGASAITAARRMVVTDGDLFPPGTVSLNGLKLYGEEIGKVVSYAATAAQAAGSQLTPLFDQLLASEGGTHLHLEDLRFYEDGGIGGTIRGESVTMGSAYFMKKHHVSLPRDLKLKTGVFLAVDGQLIAIFAIKYQPSRNVEWALRAMRRNCVTPVLATRSANITPALLKRKFRLDARPLYPDISTRLALSELTEGRGRPHAIIYRDGLMAFAETVIGSRRMRRAVRDGTVLSWLGGLSGLLLAYYFTSVGAFAALSALNFLCFLLLWLLTVLLLAGLVRHY